MDNINLQAISEAESATILAGDLDRTLPQGVRDALLDVILAWADLDMATAFFVSAVTGLNPDEGADKYGRKIIAIKLEKAASILRDNGDACLASAVEKIADEYPSKALLRRRIAHCKLAGVRRSDHNRLIFMPFEREGPPGNLAIELFHLTKFAEATAWAKTTHDFLMKEVNARVFFGEAG